MPPSETLAARIRSALVDWAMFCETTNTRNRIPDLCKNKVEVMEDGGVYLTGIVVRLDDKPRTETFTLRGKGKTTVNHDTVTVYECNGHGDEFVKTTISTMNLYEIPSYLNHIREVDAFRDWQHAEAEAEAAARKGLKADT